MDFGKNSSPNNSSPARPTVPPKPSPQSKSTVATQVNLRRKTSNFSKEDKVGVDGTSIPRSTLNGSQQGRPSIDKTTSPHSSPKPSISKPALPPKPAVGSITSPKKSVTSPPVPSHKEKQNAQLSTRSQAPNAFIQELDTLSDLSSPSPSTPFRETKSALRPPPPSAKSLSPKLAAVNAKPHVFQFPSSGFRSPSQIAEFNKKSTSLGRNFDVVSFTREFKKSNNSMSRVTPLDLSSCTNKPTSLPPSFGKAITFAPVNTLQPPPAPPRKKRSSLSSPDPTLSPSQISFPSSPKSAPVYAKVDMEKKWEMRRLKESQVEHSSSLSNPFENETCEISPVPFIDAGKENSPDDGKNSHMLTAQGQDDSTDSNNSWLLRNKPSVIAEANQKMQNDAEVSSMPRVNEAETEEIITSNNIDATLSSQELERTSPLTNIKLRVNESFLFYHVEQEKSQETRDNISAIEIRPENEGEVHQVQPENFLIIEENKLSDSFENEFEQKLETLPPDLTIDDGKSKGDNIKFSRTPTSAPCDGKPLTDAGSILKTVDMKIQSLHSFLSGISSTPTDATAGLPKELPKLESKESIDSESNQDADVVSQIVMHKFDRVGLKDSSQHATENVPAVVPSDPNLQLPDHISPPDRRKSWNCSESSSNSSDSPSSSSSSLRDRVCSITAARSHDSSWVDEGEISTGALGDLDSDAPVPASSKEELASNHPGAISRRRRIASMFSSFGKGSGGSSSSNNGQTRHTSRKTKPQFFVESPASAFKIIQGHKVMSEATVSRTSHSKNSSSMPQKTQSLPGFGYEGDVHLTKQSATSPSNNPNSSTFDSFSGSSITYEEKDETESITSYCSLYDEIMSELSPKEKKIFQVAKEILTTERTFVDVLNLLTIDFPNALKEASIHPLVSDYDLNYILGGLPELKGVNEILLSDLDERIRGWRSNPKVADIFVKKGPFLKHYSTYIRDFKAIGEYFDNVRRKYPKFDKTVMDFECSNRCQKLGLKHYMLKPVQRMPQYALLLEQYLQKLDEDCEDYQDALKAITIVRDVADHANEAIRLKENGDQMKRLQERLVHNNEILKADRQIIKEGGLEKVCRKGYQPRYFALMSDCLLCMMYNTTAGSNKDLKLRYELPLTGMKVHPTAGEDRPNEFSVISTTRSFNLVARTEKEREDWLKALGKAIHNNIKKRACSTPDMEKEFEIGKAAPVWIQDSRVTMCQICTAEFTITFRRHHCRACGKVVCGNCSGNEAPLQYLKCEAARVCDDCYQNLLEDFDREERLNAEDEAKMREMEEVRGRFKKTTPNVSKRYRHKKSIPQRLEVNSTSSAQMSGYLHWREKKSWKRRWFVLSNKVLFVCMASEDVVAYKTIPILGYDVEVMTEKTYEGVDGRLVFKLTHSGQNPMIFQADSTSSVERWVTVMREATILT